MPSSKSRLNGFKSLIRSLEESDGQPQWRDIVLCTSEQRPDSQFNTPNGHYTKGVSSKPFEIKEIQKQVPRVDDDVQRKRQNQSPAVIIHFSANIFLLSGAHLDKILRNKSECNYALPKESSLDTSFIILQKTRTRM